MLAFDMELISHNCKDVLQRLYHYCLGINIVAVLFGCYEYESAAVA